LVYRSRHDQERKLPEIGDLRREKMDIPTK